jgi:hypothetical protein
MPERAWLSDARLPAALLGREIVAVRYVGLNHSPPVEDGRRFHSIDFGFELDLAGETWSMMWQQAGDEQGVLVAPGPVPTTLGGEVVSWDFTAAWRERFPRGIGRLETVWTQFAWREVGGDAAGVSDPCLATILLDDVVVTIGGASGGAVYSPWSDELAVFWSVADARSAGVLLPGDEGAA